MSLFFFFKNRKSSICFKQSKYSQNQFQNLLSVDIYELAGMTGALILEMKARDSFVFPNLIYVKCYNLTTIGINGSRNTRTSHNFHKTLIVNEHLSKRNGFKILRAFFNVLGQFTYVFQGSCAIKMGKKEFDIKYKSEDDNVQNLVHKFYTANYSKILTEKIKNNKLNDNKPAFKFFLNVTEFDVGDSLKGAYNWNNEPLEEMDVSSRMLLEKVKNRSLNECKGLNFSVVKNNEKNGMLFLNTFYRRYVLNEIISKRIRVYVSLTTNPKRLSKLHYVLQTIDMDLVNKVFLTLPRKYRGEQNYNISRKLSNRFRKLKFLSIDHDIGPTGKILPFIQYINSTMSSYDNAAAVIISIDDDNIYDGSMVSTLVYNSLKCGVNCAVAASSQPIKFWNIPSAGYPSQSAHLTDHVEFSQDCKHTEVIEGFAGVAYRPRQFDLELFDSIVFSTKQSLFKSCKWSDDMLISYLLSFSNVSLISIKTYLDYDLSNGRPIYRCGQHNVEGRVDLPYFKDSFAIHEMNPDGSWGSPDTNQVKYKFCYQNLIHYGINSFLHTRIIMIKE
jgi:hypothetical protein